MRILLVCNEFPPSQHGGIGTMTKDLASGLALAGWNVIICGLYDDSEVRKVGKVSLEKNIEIHRLKKSNGILPPQARTLWDRFRLSNYILGLHNLNPIDLIETPDYDGSLALGFLPKIPLIVRLHGSTLYFNQELKRKTGRLIEYLEKKQILKADKIIAVSKYVGERTKLLTGDKKSYTVIYNAVDIYKFNKIKRNKQPGFLLFTGSIIPKKGIKELIQAIPLVTKDFPNVQLLLIGKDEYKCPNGENFSEYVCGLIPKSYQHNIKFMGWCPNEKLGVYFSKANLCIYPSHAEAFAIAPLEAMSVGIPVIFMKDGSGPEIIQHGVTGLLCDSRSPIDISEKIKMILEDEKFAAQLGNNGRNRVQLHFNKEKWINENISYYSKCINNG